MFYIICTCWKFKLNYFVLLRLRQASASATLTCIFIKHFGQCNNLLIGNCKPLGYELAENTCGRILLIISIIIEVTPLVKLFLHLDEWHCLSRTDTVNKRETIQGYLETGQAILN